MTIHSDPTTHNITIETTETIKQIHVFNVNGVLVLVNNTTSFSIAHLPSGIYAIHVKTSSDFIVSRFVKQ